MHCRFMTYHLATLYAAAICLSCGASDAFCQTELDPELQLYGAFERTTLTPADNNLGEPEVEGLYYGATGRLFPVQFQTIHFGLSLGGFGFFQGVDLEQRQFGTLKKGSYDSRVYGINGGVSALYHYSPMFSQGMDIKYEYGMSGNIEAKIGLFAFKEEISRLARVSIQTTFRALIWKGCFADVGLSYAAGSLTSKSNGSMSMFSSTGKRTNDVDFRGYAAVVGLGWSMPTPQKPQKPQKPDRTEKTPSARFVPSK